VTSTTWTILLVFEAIGLYGQWKVGSGRWWAWAIVLGHSVPWFVLQILADAYVAAAMAPLWWTVNLANLIRWRRDQSRPSSASIPSDSDSRTA
jgi:hypothetical protein